MGNSVLEESRFKLPNSRIPELPNRRIVKREKTFFYVLAGVVGRIGIRSCNVKDKRTKSDTQHKVNFPGFPLIYILTTFIHLDIRLTVKMKFAALLLFAAVFVCASCQEENANADAENAESNVARIARNAGSGSPGSGSPGGTTGGPGDNKGSSDSSNTGHTESSGAISINIHPEYFVMICVYVCVYLGM